MREKITKINDSNFDSLVIFPKKPAVVFLSANWSESSQLICPIFEAAADKYRTKITIYEMDVDENPIIPIAYGIRRIPAVLTFANGQFTESHTGAITKEKLDEQIEKITFSSEIYKNVAILSKKLAARISSRIGLLLSELF